jgi:hypothetical protein
MIHTSPPPASSGNHLSVDHDHATHPESPYSNLVVVVESVKLIANYFVEHYLSRMLNTSHIISSPAIDNLSTSETIGLYAAILSFHCSISELDSKMHFLKSKFSNADKIKHLVHNENANHNKQRTFHSSIKSWAQSFNSSLLKPISQALQHACKLLEDSLSAPNGTCVGEHTSSQLDLITTRATEFITTLCANMGVMQQISEQKDLIDVYAIASSVICIRRKFIQFGIPLQNRMSPLSYSSNQYINEKLKVALCSLIHAGLDTQTSVSSVDSDQPMLPWIRLFDDCFENVVTSCNWSCQLSYSGFEVSLSHQLSSHTFLNDSSRSIRVCCDSMTDIINVVMSNTSVQLQKKSFSRKMFSIKLHDCLCFTSICSTSLSTALSNILLVQQKCKSLVTINLADEFALSLHSVLLFANTVVSRFSQNKSWTLTDINILLQALKSVVRLFHFNVNLMDVNTSGQRDLSHGHPVAVNHQLWNGDWGSMSSFGHLSIGHTSLLFLDIYSVLYTLLKHRTEALMAVASLLDILKSLLLFAMNMATHISQTNTAEVNEHTGPVQMLESVARLMEEMGKTTNRKVLNKYIPFFLVHYVTCIKNVSLLPVFKRTLMTGVYSLMSLCSEHEIEHTQVLLDVQGRQVFKSLHQTFLKSSFKYQGQI